MAADPRGDCGGSGNQTGTQSNLTDRFAGLNLHGEEEEDLDLSGEVEELISEVRWLALFRVHTQRPSSHAALLNSMRNAWSCAQGVVTPFRFLILFIKNFSFSPFFLFCKHFKNSLSFSNKNFSQIVNLF